MNRKIPVIVMYYEETAMSATELKLDALVVSINTLTGGQCHSLHELMRIALRVQPAANIVDNTAKAFAPHVHELYSRVEKKIRDDEESAGKTDAEIGKECIDTVKGLIEKEIVDLKKAGEWDSDKIPTAYDQAHRKVLSAWELGLSLMNLTTVSQCEIAVRDKRKELRAAKAKKVTDAVAGDGAANDESIHGLSDLDLPPKTAAALAELLKAARESAKLNDGNTATMLVSVTDKMKEQVKKLADNMAKRSAAATGGEVKQVVNG